MWIFSLAAAACIAYHQKMGGLFPNYSVTVTLGAPARIVLQFLQIETWDQEVGRGSKAQTPRFCIKTFADGTRFSWWASMLRVGSYTHHNFKKLTLDFCALLLIPGIVFFRLKVGWLRGVLWVVGIKLK